MNKLVAGALIFLGLLILATLLLTSLLSSRNNSAQTAQPSPVPTTFVNSGSGRPISTQQATTAEMKKINRVFSTSEASAAARFQDELPYNSDSFDMLYSESLGQYFIQKKSPDADSDINEYLAQNDMTDIKSGFGSLFVESNRPAGAILQKAEDDLIKARLRNLTSNGVEPTPTGGPAAKSKEERNFVDSGKTMLSFNFGGPKPKGAGGVGAIQNPTVLDEIFNEAGAKVGTPPKMLKAIMSIECGRLLAASPAEIIAYSTPGGGLPRGHGCYQNQGGYGAYGPMQFVPGTFARYGSAVNRYGGYPHAPNIQNIRDSVYAAAELFLLNSGATGPNWGLEQMKRAYVCYAAGCRQYDTGRLGADTQRLFETFLQRYNSY